MADTPGTLTPPSLSDYQTSLAIATEKTQELTAHTEVLTDHLENADKIGQRFASTLTSAFEGVAFKGKGLGDVLKSLALSLSQSVLKSALAPLEQGIGSFVSSALKGVAFARGGVIQNGATVPFANGGVITSPISFPMSGGRTGLAGEAGAEAIMPLARGPDGRLGVVSRGGGGPGITINIQASDVESFRRSESQIAAMIARAAQLGQRNL